MGEWLREPGFVGTHATMGADLSQLMATVFTLLFIVGWVQAKGGKGTGHHWMMLGGMVAMLAFFTSYYLFRQLGVLAFEGKEGFGGPQELYDNVFVPTLDFPHHFSGHWLDHGHLYDCIRIPISGISRRPESAEKFHAENVMETNWYCLRNSDSACVVIVFFQGHGKRVFHGQVKCLSRVTNISRDCFWC